MAKISVILPCYNVEKLIDRCLTTIVNQTVGLDALEIICVDDCSTDDTLTVLKKWEQNYPDNFIIVECEQNGRQGQARNIGLSYASSEWIGFIDSDDWLELDYFEAMYNIAKDSEYEVICCGLERDHSEELVYFETSKKYGSNNIDVHINTKQDRINLILNPVVGFNAWGKIIRKKLLIDNEIFFMPNLTYEDAPWGSILSLYLKHAYVLDAKLYHYYVNMKSTVLTSNSFHHFDSITTQERLWDEYKKRGFLDDFRDALEIECIYSSYLLGIKMLILRFEEPNYNGYLLLRYLVLKRIPDYEKNPYIKNGILSEKLNLVMLSLKHELNKKQFLEFADNLKKIGI